MEELPEKIDIGRSFEEEVKTFLKETLMLSDVNGGPNFDIAPSGSRNQIDACGRHGEVLFVFECKASGKKIVKDLRTDILATATKAKIAFENYRNIPEYRDCRIFRFVFITKRIKTSDIQKQLCRDQHMYYEDENLLEYYTELNEKIGDYAIYNFLSDFGIYPPQNEQLKVCAIKAKIGDHNAYSFYVHPRDLLKYSYVARRRVGKEDFYQRMLDTTRIKKIKKFLDEGGIFPTNIILSLKNKDAHFNMHFKKFDVKDEVSGSEAGILSIEGSYDAFWIIDGQHRLYSFAGSKSNDMVSCIAFENISIEKERSFFLEINREQRPIQADLIWDLEGLSSPDSYRGIISNIAHTLNKDEKGPFFYKIYIPLYGSKIDKIVNMAALCNGINNASLVKEIAPNFLGMGNPLARDITEKPWTVTKRISDVLSKYFTLLKESLDEDHQDFVLGNAGVPIMLYVLEPIVAHIRRIPSSGELQKYVYAITDFFKVYYSKPSELKKLKSETNSEGARKNLAREIGLSIRREIKDRNFWPEMEQDEFVESIIDIERRIANLIASKLSEVNIGWERQRTPESIYHKAKERMAIDGTNFEDNLSLGDELNIILRKDNWTEVFAEMFIGKNKFENLEELKLAFTYLSKIRNPHAHGKTIIHSKEDLDQCDVHLRRFEKIIPIIITQGTSVEE